MAARMKRCSKCKATKNMASAFSANTHTRDGLSSWCRQCVNTANKERYHTDPIFRAAVKISSALNQAERYEEMYKDRPKNCIDCSKRLRQRRKDGLCPMCRNAKRLKEWKKNKKAQE